VWRWSAEQSRRSDDHAERSLPRPADDLAAQPHLTGACGMTQGQATAIIFLLAAILFVLLVGNSVVKLLWLAFGVLVIVAILWFFLRR